VSRCFSPLSGNQKSESWLKLICITTLLSFSPLSGNQKSERVLFTFYHFQCIVSVPFRGIKNQKATRGWSSPPSAIVHRFSPLSGNQKSESFLKRFTDKNELNKFQSPFGESKIRKPKENQQTLITGFSPLSGNQKSESLNCLLELHPR